MSDRIDHAAEARQALRGAGYGHNVATDAPLVALAHATLALVEQTRIGNLIALGMLQVAASMDPNGAPVGDGAALRVLYPDGPTTPPAADIAAALGIGVSTDD